MKKPDSFRAHRLSCWLVLRGLALLLAVVALALTGAAVQAQPMGPADQPAAGRTFYLPLIVNATDATAPAVVMGAGGGTLMLNTVAVSADQADRNPTDNGDAHCLPLAPAGPAVLTNKVAVIADELDSNLHDNSAGACVVMAPAATPTLVIGKAGPATATQGTDFSYTLVVTNTGTAATSGTVTVTDTLAAGLSFVSGSGGSFTCNAGGQTVTCTRSSAIAATSGTATITLIVNPTTTGIKSNTAAVIGGGDTTAATSNTVNTTVNAASAAGIEYNLRYNATTNRYEVWMRATTSPGASAATTTAQVTIKAPHLTGSAVFSPTNIIAAVADTSWSVNSRANAPTVAPNADYISFDLGLLSNNSAGINWQAGQELLIFSFGNGGVCAGPVSLMEDSDAFNAPPNNPGQQIDVFGLGVDPGNDFLGNYGLGQGDCDTDGDGIANGTDADDDGDGILDTVEGALTVDTDGDGIPNLIDADSDGDGLPDNIEAQRTSGYVVPSGSDTDNDGIDNAYDPDQGGSALTPVNTDGSDTPDYLDTDSDNAQGSDTTEAGLTKSNVDADKDGLDDGIDTNDTTFGPVNAGITTPATAYPDNDSDAGGSGDVDYRDGVDNSAVTIPVKLFLSGAYQGGGTMRTSLHHRPDFPLTSPYGDGATISNRAVLTTAQIVDWVLVEVRPVGALSNTVVISTAGLLQSDGDLVSVDGTTPITVAVTQGNYYVAVRHRNHLGAMTAAPVALSNSTVLINFTTLGSNATYGTNGQRWLNGLYGLHSGDVSGNGQVIGAGPGNDLTDVRSTVLAAPGNVNHNRNYIVYAYHQADINLDGQVILAGPGNDVEPLFDSILSHPSNSGANAAYIIYQQLPQ